MPMDPDTSLREQWSLAPGLAYLNHGSFGPSPAPVVEAYHRWFLELQQNPMEFFVRRIDSLLDEAAERLAAYVRCRGKDLIFVANATIAMNIVAENTPLGPGDEILLNDHEYGAVVRIWRRRCEATGAHIVTARLPRPLRSHDEIVEALFARASERTKMIVVSDITSPTAALLPVDAICASARQRGIATCVDGPHAVAMRPVDLAQLGCDYYCASGHKWLSGPFGSGFLYVRGSHKAQLKPPILSWGRSLSGRPSTWKDEFHWSGTYQPAAWLALPDAVKFLSGDRLTRYRTHGHSLARHARQRLIDEVGGEPLTPDSETWYGTMVTLRLPWLTQRSPGPGIPNPVQQLLAEKFRIEIPIVEWGDDAHVRVSCHLYNTQDDIERLLTALKEIRAAG